MIDFVHNFQVFWVIFLGQTKNKLNPWDFCMWFLVFELCSILYFAVVNSSKRLSVAGFAKYAVDANLFQLGSSIQKYAGSRGAAPAGGARGRSTPKIKKIQQKTFFTK